MVVLRTDGAGADHVIDLGPLSADATRPIPAGPRWSTGCAPSWPPTAAACCPTSCAPARRERAAPGERRRSPRWRTTRSRRSTSTTPTRTRRCPPATRRASPMRARQRVRRPRPRSRPSSSSQRLYTAPGASSGSSPTASGWTGCTSWPTRWPGCASTCVAPGPVAPVALRHQRVHRQPAHPGAPEAGGVFEYCPHIRSAGTENLDGGRAPCSTGAAGDLVRRLRAATRATCSCSGAATRCTG